MALKLHKVLDGHVPPMLYLPASNGGSSATYTAGQAVHFASGKIAECTAGTTADGTHYVCMESKTISTDGDPLGVVKSDEQMIWEIPNAAGSSTLTPGTAYTISTNGLTITNTSTAGCFTVLETDGADAGDLARGILV